MFENHNRFAACKGPDGAAQYQQFASFYVNFYEIDLCIRRQKVVEPLGLYRDLGILFIRVVIFSFEQAAVGRVAYDVIETRSAGFVGQGNIKQAAVGFVCIFFQKSLEQIGYGLESKVRTQRSIFEE